MFGIVAIKTYLLLDHKFSMYFILLTLPSLPQSLVISGIEGDDILMYRNPDNSVVLS